MSYYNPRTGRVGTPVSDAPMTVEALIAEAHRPRYPRSRAFSEHLTPNRRRSPSSSGAHPPKPTNYDHLYQQIVHGNAMRRTLHRIPAEPKVIEDTPDECIRDTFRRKSYAAPGTPRQFDDGYSPEPLF
ncbi:hypothetical protein C8R43DRAFT_1123574 [Mycena crocata]|nr:hypothetical protein C8R43DRAFT_1123574 [Mycena crocata]